MDRMSHHIYAVRNHLRFKNMKIGKKPCSFFCRCGDKEDIWLGFDMAGTVGGERIFSVERLLCGHCHLVLPHIKPG